MATFTAGPWRVDARTHGYDIKPKLGGDVTRNEKARTGAISNRADAILIAEAPDMLQWVRAYRDGKPIESNEALDKLVGIADYIDAVQHLPDDE
tara:strand:- start:97 stop:378 length:282 start_codon:yes stop_codon:yes gene_type:complete